MLKNNEIKDIVKVIRFLKNSGFFFFSSFKKHQNACERYQNITEKEKTKHGHEQYKNISKDEK